MLDVTLVDGRRTTECEDRARILETEFAIINPEGKLTPVYDPLGKLPESRTTRAPPFHCNWGSSILSAADKD